MPGLQKYILRTFLSWFKETVNLDAPVPDLREQIEKRSRRIRFPSGVEVQKVYLGKIPAEKIQPIGAITDKIILYFHGGGFCFCSANTHRHLVARIAKASGTTALLVEYRLAPEHPYPAARVDALRAYHCLLDNNVKPENIILAGDSAGGNLALVTAITLRDSIVQQPAGIVCISPWTDLTGSGETYQTHAASDPLLSPDGLKFAWQYYRENDPKHPLISPLFADLEGLPPILIHVGSDEILLSDSTRFAEKAKETGVDIELKIWPDLWHVFHYFAPRLPEATQAIKEIGKYIQNRTGIISQEIYRDQLAQIESYQGG